MVMYSLSLITGVHHPQKKKIGVVVDCVASFQGVSHSSELLQGPDLTYSLIGVLTGVSHCTDGRQSRAMYHQVGQL